MLFFDMLPPLIYEQPSEELKVIPSHISTFHFQVAHLSIPGLCVLSPRTSSPSCETQIPEGLVLQSSPLLIKL